MSTWTLFEPLDLSTFDFLSLGADAMGEVFEDDHFRESLGEWTLDIFGDGLRFFDDEFLPFGDIEGLELSLADDEALQVLDALWSVLRILSYYNPFSDEWDLDGLHDYLFGEDDGFFGSAGNDGFAGRGGNDTVDGNGGIDTALFGGARSDFVLTRTASGWQVNDRRGVEGRDTLTEIERLGFDDGHLALDLDGHAGSVARLIGALFGPRSLADSGLVGVGLALLDSGMSEAELATLALESPLFAQRAGSHGHADFVRTVYANVTGTAPSHATLTHYVQQLESGQTTQTQLAWLAAGTDELAARIGLTGLEETGLAYTLAG